MKVKKVLNSCQTLVVPTLENSKNESIDGLSPILQSMDSIIDRDVSLIEESMQPNTRSMPTCAADDHPMADTSPALELTSEAVLVLVMPSLLPIPRLLFPDLNEVSTTLPPMPVLQLIPDPIVKSTEDQSHNNNEMNNSFTEQTFPMNSSEMISFQTVFQTLDQILPKNLSLSPLKSTSQSTATRVATLVSNCSDNQMNETQNSGPNVSTKETTTERIDRNIDFNENQNSYENSVNGSQPMDTSIERVTKIDLNENSNSPKVSPLRPSTSADRTPQMTTSSPISRSLFPNNVSHFSQTTPQISNFTKIKTNRSPKVYSMPVPIEYCASHHRIFNLTRHSARNKSNTQDNDYMYSINTASWGEIDQTQYMATVTKWTDSEDFSEAKRLKILSQIKGMKFTASVVDEGVFHCFTAFKGESNQKQRILKSVLRLDNKAVKSRTFCGHNVIRLYLLIGQAAVVIDDLKQKSVSDGQVVLIPSHSRYSIENRAVDSTYFYVILTQN